MLQPRLNSLRQCAEVRHALQFVIRQLDAEVMLEPREQVERLQAVNAESLEKVVIRRELFPRHLEVGRGKTENFVESVISSGHD